MGGVACEVWCVRRVRCIMGGVACEVYYGRCGV